MSLENVIEINPGITSSVIDIQLYARGLVTNPEIPQRDRIHSYRLVCNDLKRIYGISPEERQYLYRVIKRGVKNV